MNRPDKEDREALRLLLGREDLSEYDAEFVDALRNCAVNWTLKQGNYFDVLWAKYY